MTFAPKLIKFDTNQEMHWIGILGVSWLFSGEHYFKLEKLNEKKQNLFMMKPSLVYSRLFSVFRVEKNLQGFNLMAVGRGCEEKVLA